MKPTAVSGRTKASLALVTGGLSFLVLGATLGNGRTVGGLQWTWLALSAGVIAGGVVALLREPRGLADRLAVGGARSRWGSAVAAGGLMVVIGSILADVIGIGDRTDFGIWQAVGVTLGAVVLVAGLSLQWPSAGQSRTSMRDRLARWQR